MRSLWLLLLTGCEKMDDAGKLFSAVQVDTPSEASEPDGAESESTFDFPELEVISSGDLQSGNIGGSEDPAVEVEAEDPVVEIPEQEPAAVITTSEPITVAQPTEELAIASTFPPASTHAPRAAAIAWPIRLVKTLPETNPPRAILGLPSGEELVVSPGTMVPEHGLVVIAIGPNSAQLAQITPQGDHAAVSALTLHTMY